MVFTYSKQNNYFCYLKPFENSLHLKILEISTPTRYELITMTFPSGSGLGLCVHACAESRNNRSGNNKKYVLGLLFI